MEFAKFQTAYELKPQHSRYPPSTIFLFDRGQLVEFRVWDLPSTEPSQVLCDRTNRTNGINPVVLSVDPGITHSLKFAVIVGGDYGSKSISQFIGS